MTDPEMREARSPAMPASQVVLIGGRSCGGDADRHERCGPGRRVWRSASGPASDLIVVFRYDQDMHRVVALAYDGLSPFELSIAVETFGLQRHELGAAWWYEFRVCAERPGPVRTLGAFDVLAHDGLEVMPTADTVIVPGTADPHGEPSAELVDALRRA